MKHQKRMYLDDSSEIERIILAEINAPGIKKADVLLDLLKLGILAKRVGIHPIAGELSIFLKLEVKSCCLFRKTRKPQLGTKLELTWLIPCNSQLLLR